MSSLLGATVRDRFQEQDLITLGAKNLSMLKKIEKIVTSEPLPNQLPSHTET